MIDPIDTNLDGRRSILAIAAVLAAVVLAVLDTAIVNVALPSIAQSLNATPSASVWVVTAYQTALVMGLLPFAALGESLGHRRVFVGGMALFTVASLLCVLSPTLNSLVAARFLQGIGASAIMAVGIALLRFTVAHSRFGAAIGWNALAVALASAAGPFIGASILTFSSWPWLFALNLPLGALVLLATKALPSVAGTSRPVDWFSVVLNGLGFAALVIGVEYLAETPMTAAILLATAAISFTSLVRREILKSAPLVPFDLIRIASFRLSVISSICCFSGVTVGLLSLPFYLQHELGQSTFATGLLMTPWPLTVAVAAPASGQLASRIQSAWLCSAGGACMAIGLAAICFWPLSRSLWPLVPLTMLCGLGFGLFQVPNNRNMFLSTSLERAGAAGGMQATARLTGQTAGGVITGSLFAMTSVNAAPKFGLAVASVLTLLAGLISLRRSGSDRGAKSGRQSQTA